MNIMSLFTLSLVFGITTAYAAMNRHWSEFGFCLFVTFFALVGFVFRLLS